MARKGPTPRPIKAAGLTWSYHPAGAWIPYDAQGVMVALDGWDVDVEDHRNMGWGWFINFNDAAGRRRKPTTAVVAAVERFFPQYLEGSTPGSIQLGEIPSRKKAFEIVHALQAVGAFGSTRAKAAIAAGIHHLPPEIQVHADAWQERHPARAVRNARARQNYLQAIGVGIGAARAAPGAVKEYREAYTPAWEGLGKVKEKLKKGELREAGKTYMKESSKVGLNVLKAHGRVAGRAVMLTEEGQQAKQAYDEVSELERETRPGKKKKKKKGKVKKNPTKQELRDTYRRIRESYYCYESPRHPTQNFDAIIKVRAQAVPGGPSSLDQWAWIALAKEIHEGQKALWEQDRTSTKCRRCAGTGQFITGMVNGKPVGPGGPCFRCSGKGRQDADDMRRNCYYDIKGIPPGNLY